MDATCYPRTSYAQASERRPGASSAASEAKSSGKNACLAAFLALVGSAVPTSRTARVERCEPGSATEDWLISVVGPPTERTDRPDGISILRYSTGERKTALGSWFHGCSSHSTIYFIVRDGVITQLWADRETERTLLGDGVTARRSREHASSAA